MTIQFKIQLRGITKPPVWRRLVMPGSFSFNDFHNVIQSAFGWEDEHLYQFQHAPYDHGWCVKRLDIDDSGWDEGIDALKTNVAKFIDERSLDKFVYVYDFGDDWIHDITIEKVDPLAILLHPVCLAGKGACPPEDCGGPWGYEEMKNGMSKNEISRFDLEYVNRKLEQVSAVSQTMKNPASDHYLDEEADTDSIKTGLEILSSEKAAPVSMSSLVRRIPEEELFDHAEDFGFSLDYDASLTRNRKAYVKAVLDHPDHMLHRLPFEDIRTLQSLQNHPHPSLLVPYYEDENHQSMMILLGFADTYYNDDGDEFMQIASDFWRAVEPHLETVMNDPNVQLRCAVESFVMGLANLYGKITGQFVLQEWVRFGYAESIEMAREALEQAYKESLRLKWNAIYKSGRDKKVEDYLFLSYWAWEDDMELEREIEKHRDVASDYRLFTFKDIVLASQVPFPEIPNPAEKEFVDMLRNDFHLNDFRIMIICHELWYLMMHKCEDTYMEQPGDFLYVELFEERDVKNPRYLKAMKCLDKYLNNMPNWVLKGHTPAEVGRLKSTEATTPRFFEKSFKKNSNGISYEEFEASFQRLASLLNLDASSAKPIGTKVKSGTTSKKKLSTDSPLEKSLFDDIKPRRNDPCPCGSGKKYKNCCGK